MDGSRDGSRERTEYLDNERSPSSPDNADGHSKPEGAPRTKRKKARRACLACQRAHLTCSDERPCHRCIKRGLDADCHDGMRKKAKYLHDAPNEALLPGVGQNYVASNEKDDSPADRRSSVVNIESSVPQSGTFSQDTSGQFNNYAQGDSAPQLQLQNTAPFNLYGAQSSPMSGPFTSQQTSPIQNMPTQLQPPLDSQNYGPPFVDGNESSMFNFDLAGMNFGNHYGALEFGMLGHMSSGANANMMHRNSANFESPPIVPAAYIENSPESGNYLFNRNGSIPDWQTQATRQGHAGDQWSSRRSGPEHIRPGMLDEPNAYSIGAVSASASGASPGSNGPDFPGYERQYIGPDSFAVPKRAPPRRNDSQARDVAAAVPPQRGQDGPSELISKKLEKLAPAPVVRKRPRDPSKIYSSVTKPYPYTLGFHALTAVLQRRFSSQKRLRIAQALASIRPSFISCTRTLIHEDLIFMEKSFQRQLWEYEDFVSACGTPTIVCRRTGEVAYAGKEFTTLTGWRKSVLLGSEPNLNVNKRGDHGAHSGTMTGSSRGGVNTPRLSAEGLKMDSPQAVFLAELLDDDDVIQFYEDFAKLAFADSKGSACKPCKLLKYKTKDDSPLRNHEWDENKGNGEKPSSGGSSSSPGHGSPEAKKRKLHGASGARVDMVRKGNDTASRDNTGINRLGNKDGKIDCMYCWTVKRDVFDIPMMIVINFLPVVT